jgi:catechol 2,3-dioxygenase-like lactoylglutathione lyase family enzyme
MITGIAHTNLLVPEGTLDSAHEFYVGTLGLTAIPVPQLQKDTTAWQVPGYHLKSEDLDLMYVGSTLLQTVASRFISHLGRTSGILRAIRVSGSVP